MCISIDDQVYRALHVICALRTWRRHPWRWLGKLQILTVEVSWVVTTSRSGPTTARAGCHSTVPRSPCRPTRSATSRRAMTASTASRPPTTPVSGRRPTPPGSWRPETSSPNQDHPQRSRPSWTRPAGWPNCAGRSRPATDSHRSSTMSSRWSQISLRDGRSITLLH